MAAAAAHPAPAPRLVSGGENDPLLPYLGEELTKATTADIAVGFVMPSGLDRLGPHLRDFLARSGRLRLLTGDYLGVTEPDALTRLLDLEGDRQLRVFETAHPSGPEHPGKPAPLSFHPKAYIFERADGTGVAFVGSSNLSDSALTTGIEWNYRAVAKADHTAFQEIQTAFDRLFDHPATASSRPAWIAAYRNRRPTLQSHKAQAPADTPEEPTTIPTPHAIQQEALNALEETRQQGNTAGLVVLATGLGKTWLGAFDSHRPEFRRILFVAHREEILNQARDTFRRIRPEARLGLYMGQEREADADVLFASIQTLGRVAHLERFPRDAFDYIVVDEFHHAAAPTYRRLIDHFRPKFLLGLTATPERTDGGDLLALCEENLVYRCDLVEGVKQDLLCRFQYFGVPDEVDYRNIPWRNSRFDEEELTRHVATQSRARNAHEQLQKRGGTRTLAFCVSQRHADFMADFFRQQGLRAVAVHSGDTSAPRAQSLEELSEGKLDVICAVDVFNEGLDLPELDTVLMLRPTESRILWLQQFGRGLRKTNDGKQLTVIDYIGNHRTFLLKPQTLFSLPAGGQEVLNLLERAREGPIEIAPGCFVTYELETIDILRGLIRVTTDRQEALKRYYEEFLELHGARPRALEAFHEGYNPRAARAAHGSWLGFVANARRPRPGAAACARAPSALPRRARRHPHDEELQDARPPGHAQRRRLPRRDHDRRPRRVRDGPRLPQPPPRRRPRPEGRHPGRPQAPPGAEPHRRLDRRPRHRRNPLLRLRERRLPHHFHNGTGRPSRPPGTGPRTRRMAPRRIRRPPRASAMKPPEPGTRISPRGPQAPRPQPLLLWLLPVPYPYRAHSRLRRRGGPCWERIGWRP